MSHKTSSALIWILVIGLLGGCRHDTGFSDSEPRLIGPPIFNSSDQLATKQGATKTTHPDSSLEVSPTIRHQATAQARAEAKASGCRPKDRLDREGAIAYNFGNDERNRLALHMSLDGPSFGNPTRFEFEEVSLRYTLKFQEHKNKKERCLYPSRYQGLIGSTYHELYTREDSEDNAFEAMYDQAIGELETRGLDFWR